MPFPDFCSLPTVIVEPVVDSWLSGTDGFGAGVGSGFGSFGISTVTLQIAVLFPSTVVTVTTAVPSAFAVTFLSSSSVASSSLSLEMFYCLFGAFLGATVAVSCTVCPLSVSFTSDRSSVTSLTAIADSPITSASLNFAWLM